MLLTFALAGPTNAPSPALLRVRPEPVPPPRVESSQHPQPQPSTLMGPEPQWSNQLDGTRPTTQQRTNHGLDPSQEIRSRRRQIALGMVLQGVSAGLGLPAAPYLELNAPNTEPLHHAQQGFASTLHARETMVLGVTSLILRAVGTGLTMNDWPGTLPR